MINDAIVAVLLSWLVPLVLFVYYFVTDPVQGSRFGRRLIDVRTLTEVSKFLLAQKVVLVLLITWVGIRRFVGDFPFADWLALGLYSSLVILAWAMFCALRRLQRAREARIRAGEDPDATEDESNPTTNHPKEEP